MKVGHVTERTDASNASSFLDNDELERTGIDLGTTGRLQLMARLAEGKDVLFDLIMSCGIFLQGLKIFDLFFCLLGTGMQMPPAAQQALQMSGSMVAMAAATGQFLDVWVQ